MKRCLYHMNVFVITRNRIYHLQVCKQAGMHIIAQLHHLTSRRCSHSHVVIYGVSGKFSQIPHASVCAMQARRPRRRLLDWAGMPYPNTRQATQSVIACGIDVWSTRATNPDTHIVEYHFLLRTALDRYSCQRHGKALLPNGKQNGCQRSCLRKSKTEGVFLSA